MSALPRVAPAVDTAALGRAATVALYDELALAPKPGLVSFVDNGSHCDMTAGTLLRSLFALRHYFPAIATAGAADADFTALQRLGIAAEARMLVATGGVNTHRGAVFTLGLLCAAGGWLQARGDAPSPSALRATLLQRWGRDLDDLARHPRLSNGLSNGRSAAQRHGLRPAAAEAALGFPVLFDVALPALRRTAHLGPRLARLQALFEVMAVLDDTNLAHRGGLDGLRWAQQQARDFLEAGGAANPAAILRAQSLHVAFVDRNLSPGGAADLLAAACWLDRVCTA
ncbi:triphosphoribosyl-dephospho-CoA synthase [Roseateles sp.]|uniref:triphosphoribosyl-dephospho-CoA synthase n=1 Tax=Roseateles sp. TaxID=1971397 RepID=UPI003BAA9381